MAVSMYFDQVQQLYIAYFGRPADPVGLNFWASQVDAANGSVGAVIAGFAASSESNALYSGVATAQKVSAIYLNLFNRLPEPAGLAYWVAQLDGGIVTQAQAAYQIQSSAGPGDAAAVANKLAMAKAFTAQIDTPVELSGYSGAVAAGYARSFLTSVDSTPASLSSATTNLLAAVALASGTAVNPVTPVMPSTPNPANTTFTLTTGPVTLTGGTGNDTFIGTIDTTTPGNSTFTAGNSLNGGAGTDTLSLTVTGTSPATLPAATLSNIENVMIRDQHTGAASVYDFAGVTGLSSVANNVSSGAVTFANVQTGTTIALVGDKVSTFGTFSFNMANLSDALNLSLSNGVKASSIYGSTRTDTVTITSSGAANQVNLISLGNNLGINKLTINAESNLTTSFGQGNAAFNPHATLTVTGTGVVDLDTTTINFRGSNIDASANSGGLKIKMNGSLLTSYTGSSGDDVLLSSSLVSSGVIVDGGAGVDTVSASMIQNSTAAQFKNFEILELAAATGNSGTYALNVSGMTHSAITGVQFSDNTGGNVTLSGLSDFQAGVNVNVTGYNGNRTTLNFSNVSGTDDVLNYSFNGISGGSAGAGEVTSQGIETINITSRGVAGILNTLQIIDDSLKSVVITGDRAMNLTVAAQDATGGSQLTSIDGSAATGGLTLYTAAATSSGVQSAITIKSGSGSDNISVTTSAVSGSVGSTVTTGTGTDSINVLNATARGVTDGTVQFTTITDFGVGDQLNLGNFTGLSAVATPTASNLAGALTQAMAGLTTGNAVWFTYGTDTYIAHNADNVSGFSAGDIVVKLTGTAVDLTNTHISSNTLIYGV